MQILKQGQYFGSQRRETAYRGVNLSEYDYFAAGTPLHYHENPYFMYVVRGQMMDRARSGSTLLPAGSLLFLNWQEAHRTEKHSRSGRGFHLQLERDWLNDHRIQAELWEGNQMLRHPEFHLLLGQIHLEFLRADAFSLLSVETLTIELLSRLTAVYAGGGQASPPWGGRLQELLDEDTEGLSLTDLSQAIGVHPVHLSRSARGILGCTIGEYQRKRRLSKAIPLLMHHERPLVDIALSSGFSDQSHFNRSFRSLFGVTPGRFRKLHGG